MQKPVFTMHTAANRTAPPNQRVIDIHAASGASCRIKASIRTNGKMVIAVYGADETATVTGLHNAPAEMEGLEDDPEKHDERAQAKFAIEFAILMLNAGRLEEANTSFEKAINLLSD